MGVCWGIMINIQFQLPNSQPQPTFLQKVNRSDKKGVYWGENYNKHLIPTPQLSPPTHILTKTK